MKTIPARLFYHVLLVLPLFAFFFLVKPTHAEAVSLYSPYSYYQSGTTNNFEIRNPAKDVIYSVWMDGDQRVQQKPVSKDGSTISNIAIKVGGATQSKPKRVCLTDEVISDRTGGIYLGRGDLCKWSVSIYVTQNTPPSQTADKDYLDSSTKPVPASAPTISAYISIPQSNFKQNTNAPVTIKNAQKGSQYYLWIDSEDTKPQVTTDKNLSGDSTYGVNVHGSQIAGSNQYKKICMNDVIFSFTENLGKFPTYYECRYFVYINVTANDPGDNGPAQTSQDPKKPDRPRGSTDPEKQLQLRMDYTNYLHNTMAGYHITNPKAGAQYYVWVDRENKPQRTKKADSTADEINDTLNVGDSSATPKKVCLNDVPFSFADNGGYFPDGYECRLYVLINVSKETPTDQGPPVNSKDNPEGNTPNSKTSPTPTPVPILPPCIEGVNAAGTIIPIPTYTPDQSNKAEHDAAMAQVQKCTMVDSAIGHINTDPFGFIEKLFQIFLSISGGIAMLIIIAAGYRYMTSQGNAEAVKAAQEQITSAVVGLLFLIFSMVLLQIIGVDILQLPGFAPHTPPTVTNSGNR